MTRHLLIIAGIIILIAAALFQIIKTNLKFPSEIPIGTASSQKAMLSINSLIFENNALIPSKYTCDADNVNPPLSISGVPEGTQSLALIMYDPDVPKNLIASGVFDHWVAFNMPPLTTAIEEGKDAPGVLGNNGAGKKGYTGPCPPDREHRYFFELYALDMKLPLSEGASRTDVENAIKGHVLGQAELIGRYNRKK
jgi:Raf kinase inhibitor-like YbhB/YbcL family protein